jgi:sporulation protein YlmC with PRC-barrel domain
MMRNINSLLGYKIHATDGELGKVEEFYFDDKTWNIRYMVVETGNWLSGRKVLIAPVAMKTPDWKTKTFPVALTREQVRNSPDIDTKKTVSRQHELELHKHYAWPLYWGEGFYIGGMSGGLLFPPPRAENKKTAEAGAQQPKKEPHLQSTRAITGYHIHAADGPIGHVEDYIVDDGKWAIRYLVAGTGAWLSNRKVLLSPHWIENIDWGTSEVFVDLTREAIKESPAFDPSRPVSEDYESDLYDHYGRPRFEDAVNLAGTSPRGGNR